MTVSLPDICVSLISDDGRSTGERYKEWCKDNLGPEFDYLTSEIECSEKRSVDRILREHLLGQNDKALYLNLTSKPSRQPPINRHLTDA
jgi:hypothetical protein